MTRCIDCGWLRVRDNPKMAALGFGSCALDKPGHFVSPVAFNACTKFVPRQSDHADKVLAWFTTRPHLQGIKAMSYVRFSSDHWRSDVYAYDDVQGGITLHTARGRRVGEIPVVAWMKDSLPVEVERYTREHEEQMRVLETLPFEPINHPEAGATYRLDGAQELLEKLTALSAVGFRVPTMAIQLVAEAAAEEQAHE